MNVLFKKVERLCAQYNNKRDYFKRGIERYNTRRLQATYQKGIQLLSDADAYVRQLQSDIAVTVEGCPGDDVIKKKLKSLREAYKNLYEMSKSQLRQWVEAILGALILAFILRNFIFGLYHVPTGSAEPNILVGDRIWGNKMAYYFSEVKRGDLVIFDNPLFDYAQEGSVQYYWQRYIGIPLPLVGLSSGPDNWVKRVIALPGDVIEGRLEDGKTVVYRNGEKLDEPYVNPYPLIGVRKSRGFIPLQRFGPLAIPNFLQYEDAIKRYTYDPSKTYEDQPFYKMAAENIIRDSMGNPDLWLPATLSYHDRTPGDVFGPYVVPKGKYWVMGDSRKNSIDSRWWLFLDEKLIHGRASFIIYSVDSEEVLWLFDLIKHPIDFWSKHIRYDRFFKSLNGYSFKG